MVIPNGSEVIVFLKVWIIGKIIASLRSMKFKMSGINGIGGISMVRELEFTNRRLRRRVMSEIESRVCFDESMVSKVGH